MTIVYCSWLTGDDTTGTGTAAAPWKSITKASASRSAGDEVRVAKSPADTALTGTVGFTLGSTAVTGSGTLFTTELVIGDFIKAPDGYYYEVVTITDNTNAVLYKVYPSATQSGYSSYKLGVTDTGEAAASTTAIQTVSSSGTSSAFLYISGGWDLSTQTQTGQTYFRQMHGTFANRYGRGLFINNKWYVNVSRLHFLRYYDGINIYVGGYHVFNSPVCLSNGYRGIDIDGAATNNTVTSPVCNSNANYGIYFEGGCNNTVTSPTCNANVSNGIQLNGGARNNAITSGTFKYNGTGIIINNSTNNTIVSPTCANNTSSGISTGGSSSNNIIVSPTLTSNTIGINASSSNNNVYGTFTSTGNTTPISCASGILNVAKASIAESTKAGGFMNYANGQVRINDMGGYAYIYTDNGNIVTQDATAGGTGKEWKFSPTNAIRNSVYPLWLPMARFAVASSGQVTVTAYFKKSGTGVAGALRCRYGQVNWSDAAQDIIVNCPDNTNRNQVTLQFTPTEAGVVEVEALAWYVSSTTETVIVDDIAISQS